MPQFPFPPHEALQSEVAAPPATSTVAGKTPEQLAKEKRIEALKGEELICYCGPDAEIVILQATPFAAIISFVLVYFVFRRSPRRTATERISIGD